MTKVQSTDVHGNIYETHVNTLLWRPAAYAIVIKDDCLLLTNQHGAFSLPGGGVELGETPANTAIREAKEETGITVSDPRLITVHSTFFTDSELLHYQSLLFYYRCSFQAGELSIAGFTEAEKKFGAMPEWIHLSRVANVKKGGSFDWHDVIRRFL